eukprot:2648914-Rhodomonas_salina.2
MMCVSSAIILSRWVHSECQNRAWNSNRRVEEGSDWSAMVVLCREEGWHRVGGEQWGTLLTPPLTP